MRSATKRNSLLVGRDFIYGSLLAVLFIMLSAELYFFASVQDIWVDETTQLSGITLSPLELLRWLSGINLDRFGVPGDRMPPGSYMIDWIWLHLSGPSVFGFRLFHSTLVVVGVGLLVAFSWRTLGPASATLILAFLTFSPKLIQTAVEIRAYPIFFVVTCVQASVFVVLVSRDRVDIKQLFAFAMICLAAIYTHFYGIVSTCAFFLALGIAFFRSSESLVGLAVASASVMVGSLGLLPFVSSAVVQSPPTTGQHIIRYLIYPFRLFGDAANTVSVTAFLLFFLGALALFSAGAFSAFARAKLRTTRPFDWLWVVAIAGIFATIAASLVIRTFDVLNSSYSSWLFVLLALLIGVGAALPTGFRFWDDAGRFVAGGAMLVGAAISTHSFLRHASMFVHGPGRFVSGVYDKVGFPKAIVYEAGSAWGFSYFPLAFSYNQQIIQYRSAENKDGLIRIGGSEGQPVAQRMESALESYNNILLVDVRLRTAQDLRRCQNHPSSCPQYAIGEVGGWLAGTGNWTEYKAERSFGLYDAQIRLFKRVPQSAAPSVNQ